MSSFLEYQTKYENIRLVHEDGILEFALHTGGNPYINSAQGHREICDAFRQVGDDPENRIMIFTGTGPAFCVETDRSTLGDAETAEGWYRIAREGKQIVLGMLDIDVPVISVVNGPVSRHSELLLLGDIVLAADSATFQEGTHFPRMVPGDGMHILWPYLLGDIRGRYFLLTGQVIDATEALRLGIVNEVLPHDKAIERAWDIAHELLTMPDITLRYTRSLFTHRIRELVNSALGYGLALEGLSRMGAAHVTYGSGRSPI